MTSDDDDTASVLAEGTAQMGELLAHAVELGAGQRARALAAGFSETAAEQMGTAAHMAYVQMIANGMRPPDPPPAERPGISTRWALAVVWFYTVFLVAFLIGRAL